MNKNQLEELNSKFKHKYGLDFDFDSLYSENKTEIEVYNSIELIIEDLSIDNELKDRLKKEQTESLSKTLKQNIEYKEYDLDNDKLSETKTGLEGLDDMIRDRKKDLDSNSPKSPKNNPKSPDFK